MDDEMPEAPEEFMLAGITSRSHASMDDWVQQRGLRMQSHALPPLARPPAGDTPKAEGKHRRGIRAGGWPRLARDRSNLGIRKRHYLTLTETQTASPSGRLLVHICSWKYTLVGFDPNVAHLAAKGSPGGPNL